MNPWGLSEAQERVMDAFLKAGCAKGAARLLDCSINNVENRIHECRKKMSATNRLHFFIQWDRWKRQDALIPWVRRKGCMKVSIDFDYVPTNQADMDKRLINWARWVTVRPHGLHVAPMFRQAQSNSRQWHPPEIKDPVNSLDAVEIEKAVSALPDKHKMALRWFYVFKNSPVKLARSLGLTLDGLFDLIIDARSMLKTLANK